MSNQALDACFGLSSFTEDELKLIKNRRTNNMDPKNNQIAVKEQAKITASERFVNKLISKLSVGELDVKMTDFQKRLAQSYMTGINKAIITAESKRYAKINDLPYSWNSIKIDDDLADAVVSFARCGLDPMQPNHLSPVLYKDKAANVYTVSFIPGYRGRELKAKKYGLDVPDYVIVELVYVTDIFKSIKKDMNHTYESYEFEIVNEFDRGEIKGGFWYHGFSSAPERNKLITMSKKEIDKHRPDKFAPEFWGGDKDVWKDGKKIGTEKIDGWYEKMAWKTLYADAYKNITIDPKKIDDDYYKMQKTEIEAVEAEVEEEIELKGNKEIIDIDSGEIIDIDEAVEDVVAPAAPAEDGPGY